MSLIHETGLTVVFEPEEPSVDIVFLHGFTGHPERTWMAKKATSTWLAGNATSNETLERLPKFRKLNPFSSSHQNGETPSSSVYWPRDLLPITIPSARVLTYGYDTHIRHWVGHAVNKSTVYSIAWDALVALESERRTNPSRPLLFVAHSLGGIVVKEMLRRSNDCNMGQSYLRGVFESTVGIIFFGTPHYGSDPRSLPHHIIEKLAKAMGFLVNEEVVRTLLPSSERLQELRDGFGPMAQDRHWTIHSFQEQHGVQGLLGDKVVQDNSSCLNIPAIETTEHIERNHMAMCRFGGSDDPEYKKVAAAMCRITNNMCSLPTTDEPSLLSPERKREMLDSLLFEEIDARQMNIKNTHAKTCRWLLNKSEYLDWINSEKLHEHHGFFWIKGKPGSGKSTLMKFILNNARRKMNNTTILSFFFNARGTDLEKSTTGLYRSLLFQLLKSFPDLQNVFATLRLTWSKSAYQWSIELLKSLFEQSIQSLRKSSLVCFIDALDECDEQQTRDMISFFEHLGNLTLSTSTQFRICFSSRHYPHITIVNGLSLILEGQEGHTRDIASYIDSELKIEHGKLAEEIRDKVQEKASGVFMWVVLVVDILNKEHDRGRVYAIRKRLNDIPADLHELFRDILTRDRYNTGELILSIQWVLFAKQPLRPEQLYFGIMSGLEPEALLQWDANEITTAVIKRFILDASKGLAEVTKSKNPTVQFIHESVKDFLLKKNGLKEIWSGFGVNFEGESQERLKQCCLAQIHDDIVAILNIRLSLPKASSQEAAKLRQLADSRFPFLEYAAKSVLYHSNAAQSGGVDQTGFLQKFLEKYRFLTWIQLNNLFERYEVRRHSLGASSLYILAESNMAALIRIHPLRQKCFIAEYERYGPPMFAALATGSIETVRTFADSVKDIQPSVPPDLLTLCMDFPDDEARIPGIGRDFTFSQKRTVLSYILTEWLLAVFIAMDLTTIKEQSVQPPLSLAISIGAKSLTEVLISMGEDVELKDEFGQTPLCRAALHGDESIIKLLLSNGASLESQDNRGFTPLFIASERGHLSIVSLLLDAGADIDTKSKSGETLLSYTIRRRNLTVLRLLLQRGVDLDVRDASGNTPLIYAAEEGCADAVRLLIENGADVEMASTSARTPLSYAASKGHMTIINFLLQTKRANINSKDIRSQTPLIGAAAEGRDSVVELLIKSATLEIDWKDTDGQTALSWACAGGKVAVVKRLLKSHKVDINSQDHSGRSPLIWTALDDSLRSNLRESYEPVSYNGPNYALQEYNMQLLLLERQNKKRKRMERQERLGIHAGIPGFWWDDDLSIVTALLLENGAEPNLKDYHNQTSLFHASSCGRLGIVQLLIEKGAAIDMKDYKGQTPLFRAAANGHVEIARLLLDRGANASLKDDSGRTLLSYASEGGHDSIVEFLLGKGAVVDSNDKEGDSLKFLGPGDAFKR